MKRSILSIVTIWAVVIAGVLGGLLFINEDEAEVSAATLFVGGAGPGNYSTIQQGIDNASAGDTVFVYNGTYYENVIVNKTINLTGEDRDNTTIDGNGTGDVILVTADWVNITRFTISGSGTSTSPVDAGIELNNVQYCTVFDNIVISIT